MNSRITFRVSKIPANITTLSLARYLAQSFANLGPETNVHVRSLGETPDAWTDPPEQIGTVEFDELPLRFAKPNESRWLVSTKDSKHELIFDRSFIGFTPLNTVNKDNHAFDCIAISGLASHPFGSWRQRNTSVEEQQFMWLRDQLAKDFPRMRVMLYGYDTSLSNSQSFQNIDDLSRSFVALLRTIGAAEASAKPLILFAHSLGGLLVKRAIVYLAGSGEAETQMLRNIRLLVFFGVPHRGMHIDHLRTIVKSQPNQDLIHMLSVHSPFLSMLEERFAGILAHRPIRLVSTYETVKSPVAELQPSGLLQRTGVSQVLVSRDSAIHPSSRGSEDVVQVDRDHSNMVKFACDDPTYYIIRRIIFESSHGPQGTHKPPSIPLTGNSADPVSSEPSPLTESTSTRTVSNTEVGTMVVAPVLASLAFEEQDNRLNAIDQAQDATFAWIIDNEDLGFMKWVQEGCGVYWIRGKPGSGKSTLFRYLHDNAQFREMLSARDFAVQHIDVWHFFNERGTYLQKSIQGFLRSLLYQLALSDTTLAELIMQVYYSQPRKLRGRWTMKDINQAFAAIMSQDETDVELTIFLDALDEYQGFPEVIVKWIKDCLTNSKKPTSRTKTRFCFSSREWDTFVKAFEDEPGFQLHKQTKSDITNYIRSRVCDLPVLAKNAEHEFSIVPDAMVDLLVDRAEGVFLWVKLALDEAEQLPASSTIEDVKKMLSLLPGDLEDFYRRIVSRIPQNARLKAFTLVELVFRWEALMTLDDLIYAEACSSGTTFSECRELVANKQARESRVGVATHGMDASGRFDQPTALAAKEKTKPATAYRNRNLLNLCGGLLECVRQPSSSASTSNEKADSIYVQFIHRTVRDFISQPNFSELMLGRTHSLQTETGFTFLFKHCCLINDGRLNPDRRLMLLAYRHERTTGTSCSKFLNSLPAYFFVSPDNDVLYRAAAYSSQFLFGVVAGLRLFLHDYLSPSTVQITRQNYPEALNLIVWNVVYQDKNQELRPEMAGNGELNQCEMIKLLLEHGFGIAHRHFGLTPFDTIFHRSFEGFGGAGGSEYGAETIRIAETLIKEGGQDPNVRIHHRNTKYKRREGLKWLPETNDPWCAVHVSHGNMLEMLLKAGADPNVQDAKGNTALDICVGCSGNVFEIGDHRRPDEASATTLMLLQHGAKLTRRGAILRPVFLKIMEGYRLLTLLLNKTEVLDVPVEVDDIPDFDYFLKPADVSPNTPGDGS